MFHKLELKRFLELAKTKTRIAVFQEITGDKITPISVYHALSPDHKGLSLLESCGKSANGRYSYLCLQPYDEFIVKQDEVADPLAELRERFNNCACYSEHELCHYAGAAVGFINYDAVRFIEDIPDTNPDVTKLPELFFRFYRTCVAFDHDSGKVVVATAVDVSDDPELDYQHAINNIEDLIATINSGQVIHSDTKKSNSNSVKTDVDDVSYMGMVEQARQYIIDGDAFQIVLSRTFKQQYTAEPFDIYRALRITNPSPYMFYIEHDNFTIVGASPERLVSVKDKIVTTNPIAGTRPRGNNASHDLELEHELLQDEKEIAEHMMLVDLGRNDLGAVCKPGSVEVTQLKTIQRFSRVMHIASVVEGELAENKDLIDVIKAVFPAGTLSGAPKIRAMEIIDELETSRRGLYGGAICIVDGRKNLDACIAIRMAVLKDNIAYVRAGAGIVYDSIPQKEADETRHKARAVFDAIKLAQGGLQ